VQRTIDHDEGGHDLEGEERVGNGNEVDNESHGADASAHDGEERNWLLSES